MRILIAEDNDDLNRVVTAALKLNKYDVDSSFDGEEAMEYLKTTGYDAIILDLMMPKMDGMEVLKRLREMNIFTPVLILTAKSEVEDKISGLDAGADDYLTKPYDMQELLARVRSMTRRHANYQAKELKFEDLELDSTNMELSAINSVRLSIKEFELMQTLILNSDRTLDNEYLMKNVWTNEENVTKDTVFLYISYLKGKLTAVDSVATIEGDEETGYRLVKV